MPNSIAGAAAKFKLVGESGPLWRLPAVCQARLLAKNGGNSRQITPAGKCCGFAKSAPRNYANGSAVHPISFKNAMLVL
jgi:hypothetical protein